MIFQSKSIRTNDHHMLGMEWSFQTGTVEMHREGFQCSCKAKPRTKCNHIKWVELNILGVNAKEFKT